ncbi:MAG: VanZ family protein [Phycisphaerae bacterium]
MRARYPFLRKVRLPLLALYSFTLVCAIIASHTPERDLPGLHGMGKALHFTGFAGMSSLLILMLAGFGELRIARVFWTLLFMAAYAALDESTQGWFERHPEFDDWLIDVTGTVLAVIFWEVVLAWVAARRRKLLRLQFKRPGIRVETDSTPTPRA